MSFAPLPVGLVVALVGVAILMVRATVLARVRRLWPGLLGCSLCFGFWVGVGAGLVSRRWWWFWLDGATVALASLIVDAALVRFLGDPHA